MPPRSRSLRSSRYRKAASPQFAMSVRDGLQVSGIDFSRPLLAAVSGGPDSTALLLALIEIREQEGLEIVAAHFNHRLRGSESDADQSFVEQWCAGNEVRCITGEATPEDKPLVARLSPEAGARELRYAFLARAVSGAGAQAVATGHTLDDQAETILLHLVRGSGLVGAAGMRVRSKLTVGTGEEVTVVRPLLNLRRADTRKFCEAHKVAPRVDASNLDVSVPRNRLRHEVIPLLEMINPGTPLALSRFGELARSYVSFVEAEVDRTWPTMVASESSVSVTFSRAALKMIQPVVLAHAFVRAFRNVTKPGETLDLIHLEEMADLILGGSGTSLDLPGGVRMKVSYRLVSLESVTEAGALDSCPFPAKLRPTSFEPPARVTLGKGFDLRAQLRGPDSIRIAGPPTVALLDADVVGPKLQVRARARGDRFHPLGAPSPKKLQDFFVDTKVPREWRDRVPIVETDRGIAWIAGYRIAEWAKVRRGKTRRVLRLELLRERS
ncbi:MAG: tRNA lysidine(34) synthetase TilS [Chloroflexi bacterium]|nr:tRNA lysidine(34) synthetase TilS [Chloroflexota bacterium]